MRHQLKSQPAVRNHIAAISAQLAESWQWHAERKRIASYQPGNGNGGNNGSSAITENDGNGEAAWRNRSGIGERKRRKYLASLSLKAQKRPLWRRWQYKVAWRENQPGEKHQPPKSYLYENENIAISRCHSREKPVVVI